jgi:hypothetical protein
VAIVAPFLPYETLRRSADQFLANYHKAGTLPVPIERIVEFDLGLDIVPVPGLLREFEVDAFITSDLTEIRVDREIQQCRENRYHFSLAHEVAHLFLHKEVFEQLAFSKIQEWKDVLASLPEDPRNWIEYQAYCWGGLALVPATPLRDCLNDCIAKAKAVGVEWEYLDDHARRPILSSIAKMFAVSMDVIKKRVKYDKLG